MANPDGINQLGSDRVPYGQAKRMKQLAGEAPMSGAPLAAPAINAPQRARRRAPVASQRPSVPPTQQGPIPAPAVAGLQQTPTLSPSELYSAIAAIPGASSEVQQIFGGQSS